MSDDVRDVIARAVNAGINQHGFTVTKPIHKDRAYVHVSIEVIDAILAALHEAGYEVGKKPTVRHEVFPFTDADVLPPDETP